MLILLPFLDGSLVYPLGSYICYQLRFFRLFSSQAVAATVVVSFSTSSSSSFSSSFNWRFSFKFCPNPRRIGRHSGRFLRKLYIKNTAGLIPAASTKTSTRSSSTRSIWRCGVVASTTSRITKGPTANGRSTNFRKSASSFRFRLLVVGTTSAGIFKSLPSKKRDAFSKPTRRIVGCTSGAINAFPSW